MKTLQLLRLPDQGQFCADPYSAGFQLKKIHPSCNIAEVDPVPVAGRKAAGMYPAALPAFAVFRASVSVLKAPVHEFPPPLVLTEAST